MKARRRDNLIERAKEVFTLTLDMDDEYIAFLKSIEGKDVELVLPVKMLLKKMTIIFGSQTVYGTNYNTEVSCAGTMSECGTDK